MICSNNEELPIHNHKLCKFKKPRGSILAGKYLQAISDEEQVQNPPIRRWHNFHSLNQNLKLTQHLSNIYTNQQHHLHHSKPIKQTNTNDKNAITTNSHHAETPSGQSTKTSTSKPATATEHWSEYSGKPYRNTKTDTPTGASPSSCPNPPSSSSRSAPPTTLYSTTSRPS